MSRKLQHVAQNADPELEALMRPVLRDLFLDQLEELKDLTQPIATPYRVDPKDPRAGEKFLDQHKAMQNARAARKRDAYESLRLLESVRTLMAQPRGRVEADEAEDAHNAEAAKAQALLDAVRGKLSADELKQLRTETYDAFNVPTPPGSDPDEGSDA